MSSIESAPATIPPTSEATFNPAFAPLSVGTVRCCIGQLPQPGRLGQRQHRDQPADDTRFGSSNTAEVARSV